MRAPSILLAALMFSACAPGPLPVESPKQIALPGPNGAPPPPPGAAAAAADPGLVERERELLKKMLATLYSPCPEQAVSIQQCVDEARACAACKPAATLLAQKIKEGANEAQARALYGVRFGPNQKQVEAADSPVKGPANAPVTLVVWSDFECPHCRRAMPILDRLVEKFSPRVRVVHKFYPLQSHTHAEPAARAAIAALNQGKFFEMEHVLFEHQHDQTDSDLLKYATDLKLDLNRYQADLKAERTSKMIERDRADADRLGLEGTPFILINGREFDSSFFHLDADLEDWVKTELELKR